MVHLLQTYSNFRGGISPLELAAKAANSSRRGQTTPPTRRTAKQFHEPEIDRLVERYREVRNMRAVAREFGISRTTVAKHLADRGVDTSNGMKPFEIAKARALYAQGVGSGRIGALLGFDNKTILKAVKA